MAAGHLGFCPNRCKATADAVLPSQCCQHRFNVVSSPGVNVPAPSGFLYASHQCMAVLRKLRQPLCSGSCSLPGLPCTSAPDCAPLCLLPAPLQDGTADLLVAHHEHFQLLDIVDQELSESRGQHVLRLLVAPIPDVGHQNLTLEPPANSVIDTSRFPPVALKE